MKIENAKSLPEIYYGLHFAPGVAQYEDPVEGPFRVYIDEEVAKEMDPSFKGRPVYVDHVDQVNLDDLQMEADGYVIRSFYNQLDGKHWAEFIVVSDRGKEAIRKGWQLSNAYTPNSFSTGGSWHGVDYQKKVMGGAYDHLAIVPNPRYEESIILTSEEFKNYKGEKAEDLQKLMNSKEEKGEGKMGFSFFKRTKLENSADLESTVVMLPKSKKEMSIAELVTEHDKVVNMSGYANEEHMVKCGADEMSVKDLVKHAMDMRNELAEMKKPKEEEKEENSDESMKEDMDIVGDRGGDEALKNKDAEEEITKNESKVKAAEKAKALKNAGPKKEAPAAVRIDTMEDKLARGKELF